MVLKRLSGRHSINRKPRQLIDVLLLGLPFTSSACGDSSGQRCSPKQDLEYAIELGRGGVYLKLTPRGTPGSCIAKTEPLGAPFV